MKEPKGGMKEEQRKEKTDAVKGTESASKNHGRRQELIEPREREERQNKRKTDVNEKK